jgi:hypothetical protein
LANEEQATTTVANWNFHTFHVQSELKGGQFVSAESTLLAAGPPEITGNINQPQGTSKGQGLEVTPGSELVNLTFPVGVMENVGLSQSKQLQRIFEIGSSRAYFIPGRVVGSISFGRVFYHGVSLLRALYAYYTSDKFNINPAQLNIQSSLPTGVTEPDLSVNPGYDHFWFNLYSDVFNQPTGSLLYFRDMANVDVGGLYLEYLYVQGHQLSISSGSVLLMEGTSGQFDRIVPVRMRITAEAA